jgi:hypothetical protein
LENVDIFYVHVEYFMDIWDILWPFGTLFVHLVNFFQFWYHEQKNLATLTSAFTWARKPIRPKLAQDPTMQSTGLWLLLLLQIGGSWLRVASDGCTRAQILPNTIIPILPTHICKIFLKISTKKSLHPVVHISLYFS